MTSWAYFATREKADEETTLELIEENEFLCRPARNRVGAAIANVGAVRPGDLILLLYDGWPVGWLTVLVPDLPIGPQFPAITRVEDPDLEDVLESWDYLRDPVIAKFTGFCVRFLRRGSSRQPLVATRYRRPGNNALHELEKVLGREGEDAMSDTTIPSSTAEPSRPATRLIPVERFARRPERTCRYLGVDVGFSRRRESLGYCILEVDPDPTGGGLVRVPDGGFGLCSLPQFLEVVLPRILERVELDGAALDGPMTPHPATLARGGPCSYRPCELALCRNSIPSAIRAQGFFQPVGHRLYESTMTIRNVLVDHGFVNQSFGRDREGVGPFVVESFPKYFLGTLLPPAEGEREAFVQRGVAREERDRDMARRCFEPGSPIRDRFAARGVRLEDGLTAVLSQKDVAAAFVSGFGALLASLGCASMLGDPQWGSFLGAAPDFWDPDWLHRMELALATTPDRGLGLADLIDGVFAGQA